MPSDDPTPPSRHEIFDAIDAKDAARVRAILAADRGAAAARDPEGLSAVRFARYRGLDEIVGTLLAVQPELDLWDAAAVGDLERLRAVLDADPGRIGVRSNDGMTPLGLAAFFDHPEAARFLLERDADTEQRSLPFGSPTPLHSAVAGNHPAAVRVLLEYGADPNAEQTQGWRALHSAAQHGNVEIVRLLLDYDADPTLTTADGRTPAAVADGPDRDEVARLLDESAALR
jgi:adenosylhomocysteine nucleosidase